MTNVFFSRRPVAAMAVFCMLLLCGCASAQQDSGFTLTIDLPSADNSPMPTGRSFYVSGKISSGAPVPDGAVLEVDMLDRNGRVIRHVAGSRLEPSKLYLYPDMYRNINESEEKILSVVKTLLCPEYLVEDPSDPDSSFRNAEIKCLIHEDVFWALIVGGTDTAHGAAVDDGCHFTAADGSPYTAPEAGEYLLRAKLTASDGTVLATAERPLLIGDPANALIMRFHPDRYLNDMLGEIAGLIDYQTNIDYIPGFLSGLEGNAGGRTLLFKANDMALYRNAHSYLQIYLIDPTSSSWTVEMPYLYYRDHVDDPEHFTCCYFDIGEPSLQVGDTDIHGRIVPLQPGDHHEICRIDTVEKGTAENVFDIAKPVSASALREAHTENRISADSAFAVMGVLAPAKLEDCCIFDPEEDQFSVTNRIETLRYTFTCEDTELRFEKPVYLHRENVEEAGGNYDSVLEYYHVFEPADFEAGRTYRVTVRGYDKNGNEVDGTEEQFSIRWGL